MVVDLAARADESVPSSQSVTATTIKALQAADRMEHPAGQSALVLARRLDAGTDTGSALAALAREHGARLESALAGTQRQASPLDRARDELARRRARRGA